MSTMGACLALSLSLLVSAAGAGNPAPQTRLPSFLYDVMPVLSKAGCNAGSCHGNRNGRGGFRLSLRGQDPDDDHQALAHDRNGRRLDLTDPEQSLILRKSTRQIAHEGGERFEKGSLEYELLLRWIAAGAPGPSADEPQMISLAATPPEAFVAEPHDEVPLTLSATLADGSTRDVTRLTVYETSNTLARVSKEGVVHREQYGETTVLARFLDRQIPIPIAFIPRRENFHASDPPVNNFIDRLVWEKLRRLRMLPADLADDSTFLRRAYLDAIGLPPTADEAQRFLHDNDPQKRARLIDQLLSRTEFAEFWALKWSDLLRNEEKVLDAKGVDAFHGWMRDSFANDKPLDQFVREIVAARGSTYENPPANFWRALRNPIARGETTSQVFLGVRLQCAQCHNHPFDHWTQDDYYSWASVFARIDYEIVDNKRRDKFDKHEFKGEQIVIIKDEGSIKNPRTDRDAEPRFLGVDTPELADSADRLIPASEWITSEDNPWFARTQANRIWFQLMGRGIVEPVDDFRATNPPSNPPLLAALADEFVEHGYDVKHLVRTIMNSRTYQLSSTTNETNADDEANFARTVVRRLSAEQLLDAQCQVLGVAAQFNGYDRGTRAGQVAGVERVRRRDKPPAWGDRFLIVFGRPQRLLACECERSNATTLAQALVLVGGEGLNRRLAAEGNRLEELAKGDRNNREIVVQLYWEALSRPPKEEELAASLALLASAPDRRVGLEDVAWALLNAKEFVFRH